jgi:hypothetical protein
MIATGAVSDVAYGVERQGFVPHPPDLDLAARDTAELACFKRICHEFLRPAIGWFLYDAAIARRSMRFKGGSRRRTLPPCHRERDAAAGMRVIGAVTARGPGLNCSHPR